MGLSDKVGKYTANVIFSTVHKLVYISHRMTAENKQINSLTKWITFCIYKFLMYTIK